jgi:hypothetical protein
MSKSRTRGNLALQWLFLFSWSSCGCSQHAPAPAIDAETDKKIDGIVRKIQEADAPSRFTRALRELLEELGPDGLQRFKFSAQPTLALYAAWEGLYLPLTEKETPPRQPVPLSKLQQFLTAMKNTVGETPPSWWEKTILNVRYDDRGLISCGEIERPPYHKAGLGNLAPSDTFLEKQGDKILVKVAADSVTLPAKEIPHVVGQSDVSELSLSACLTPKQCFIALHFQLFFQYELICFDRTANAVVWTATVYAESGRGTVSGNGQRHGVTIRTLGETVLVYGGGNFSVYVEGFKMNDGTNLFRFCADN